MAKCIKHKMPFVHKVIALYKNMKLIFGNVMQFLFKVNLLTFDMK